MYGDPKGVEDVYPCRQDRWVLGVLGPDGDRANPDIVEPQLGVVVTWENLQKNRSTLPELLNSLSKLAFRISLS